MALIDKYIGAWTQQTAEHLLRRTTFGAPRALTLQVQTMGMDAAVNTLLSTANAPLPNPPISFTDGTTFHDKAYDGNNDNGIFAPSMRAWWLDLMYRQGLSLREKMTLFWHSHLVSNQTTVADTRYMYRQNQLLRRFAMGNIRTLLYEITIDPAMLLFLNGNVNRADGTNRANENYARELQELFTIGKGPERATGDYTNYTENDIRAAARVLSGWTIPATSRTTGTITVDYNLTRHDPTDKQFSAAYGNTIIRGGRTAADGPREINELLDMIFRQAETARNYVRQLYVFFFNADISNDVEMNFIRPLADELMNNRYEVLPTLRRMFSSEHFYSTALRGCMIKNPVDLTLDFFQRFNVVFPTATQNRLANYNYFNGIRNTTNNLQMSLLDAPTVFGWPPYYQTPDMYRLWISTATMPQRTSFLINTLASLTGGGLNQNTTTGNVSLRVDLLAFAQQFSRPDDPTRLVIDIADLFLPTTLTDTMIGYIVTNVLVQGISVAEWPEYWKLATATNSTAANRTAVTTRLLATLQYIVRMAEFQLM
jgi:uncharacterized protein (DUF1800 family)